MFWSSPPPNPRQREEAELNDLIRQARSQQINTAEAMSLVNAVTEVLDPELKGPMVRAFQELVDQEQAVLPTDISTLDLREKMELKTKLRKWLLKTDGTTPNDILEGIFSALAVELPKTKTPSPFTVPLINTLQNPKEWISRVYKTLHDQKYLDRDILSTLRERMYVNLCYHSGIEPWTVPTKSFKHAVHSDIPLNEVNDTYLRGTPFHDLFNTPVPLRLTHDDRMGHMHILGGTGAGKTSLLERLLLNDLQSDDPPSLVVLDPHSDLVRKLAKVDTNRRRIVIDPRDTQYPPALNVFALNRTRLNAYDEATREQVIAGAIQTFEFLFAGFGIDLTGKQAVLFRNSCRLMLALPDSMGRNATILDMMHLMRDPAPYMKAVATLPDISREFFERDFKEQHFKQTRDQIRYRLQAIVENPTMARLFTSEETKVDLFEELNNGSLILVDCANDFLKDASATFGQLFLSLVYQAVLERAATKVRKDTFIYVDEAASFFSNDVSDMLTELRKYRAGLVLAHQYLDQASGSLRASIAANTGIKFASGISSGDARNMASDMRTTAEFILNQPQLQFAAYIRNVTPHAVSIPIRWGVLDDLRTIPGSLLDWYQQMNRDIVSLGPTAPSRPPEPPVSPQDDEDISYE